MKRLFSSQSGNALWFVLLAVALLGMLTAVLSRTSSNVQQTGSFEQTRIKAAALLRYTQSIEAAIQQMIMNGTSENLLDFKALGPEYDNPDCTEDPCVVFDTKGGGISYRTAAEVLGLDSLTENWRITAANRLHQFGCDTERDMACGDLILLLPALPKQICLQINTLADIKNPSDDAPAVDLITLTPPFQGSFTEDTSTVLGAPDPSGVPHAIQGKSAGCVRDSSTKDTYVFYQVLIGR